VRKANVMEAKKIRVMRERLSWDTRVNNHADGRVLKVWSEGQGRQSLI
jgi:hypothetical protein